MTGYNLPKGEVLGRQVNYEESSTIQELKGAQIGRGREGP